MQLSIRPCPGGGGVVTWADVFNSVPPWLDYCQEIGEAKEAGLLVPSASWCIFLVRQGVKAVK